MTRPIVGRTAALLNRLRLGAINQWAKRLLARSGRDLVTVEADGLVLSGPMTALRTLTQIGAGTYEQTLTALFKAALETRQVVVDVGAHVGYYTLIAAREVGPAGRVYAFEPDPRTQPFLEGNARRNGLANVTVVRAAASDTVTTREMYLASNANRSSLHPSATLDGLERMATVDSVSVDSVLGDRKADVVKVDAEGSEPEVLRGMQRSLKPETVVFLEFNPPVLESAGDDPRRFGRWLFDAFERVERIGPEGATAIPGPPEEFANLRCTGWRDPPATVDAAPSPPP